MRVPLIADERKPNEFMGENDYFIIADIAPISVGDVIIAECNKDLSAKVLAIWVILGRKFIPFEVTDSGHKHIIRLDKNLGRVQADHTVVLKIVSS